jgi:hypothetical protein
VSEKAQATAAKRVASDPAADPAAMFFVPSNSASEQGYEYDIFVSYRRGGVVDDWVRRFV